MESALLDATAFPHIYERVVAHAPYELLLRLRLVSRASLESADRKLFEHIACSGDNNPPVFRSLSSISSGSSVRRLPIPPLAEEDVHPDSGLKYTQMIDIETFSENLDIYFMGVRFPALQTVRRRAWTILRAPATVVDVLRFPPHGTFDSCISPLVPVPPRHVILVLFDPLWDGLAWPINMIAPFWDVDVHAIIVFRSCPRVEGLPIRITRPQDDQATGTFLRFFLRLVAHRHHKSYSIVGLEHIPPHILAEEVGLTSDDLLLAAAHQSTGDHQQWARVVAERTVDAIGALPTDAGEFLSDDEEFLDLKEIVEVLTLAEYRAREGEEVWERELFGDELPAPLIQL
ncbi:hypothetical protein CC85DRAFT_281855, partial [Cutaneotrichosporon oleaginosum]